MNDPTVFVDSNVLVYVRDARFPGKQAAAAAWMAHLWETRRGRLSAQVLQEYYVTMTAKLDPGLQPEEAREDLLALSAWSPLPLTQQLTEGAWDVQDRWGFSFWDSLIVSAARAACGMALTPLSWKETSSKPAERDRSSLENTKGSREP